MSKPIEQNIMRLTIDLPKEVHRRIKTMAAKKGTTIRSIVQHCVTDYLKKEEQCK